MAMLTRDYATDGSEPPTQQVAVVHRVGDGAIVHVHAVVTEVGGEPTTDDDVLAEGLAWAEQFAPAATEADLAAILTEDLDTSIVQRVDVATGRLVPVDVDTSAD